MDKRRTFFSTLYVIAFAFLWMQIAPKLFPQFFQRPAPPGPGQQQVADNGDDPPADEPEDGDGAEQPEGADPDEPPAPEQLVEHPRKQIELGSLVPESGYFMKATLTSRGGAIERVELNDPRYTSINNREAPLKVVGDDSKVGRRTLETSLDAMDKQLKEFGTSLAEVDWRVADQTENEVTFAYSAPDGGLEVRKHYRLNQGDIEDPDESVTGYLVDFELTVENLSEKPKKIAYTLLGPVGVPLEDRSNSRTYVEVKAGTLDDPDDPTDVSDINLTAAGLVKEVNKAKALNNPNRLTIWRAPIKYIGTDVQYFAALIIPDEDQLQNRYFKQAQPVIIKADGFNNNKKGRGEWSDVSVELTSVPVTLKPDGKLEHSFQVFFGPKRSELLEPIGAGGAKALGWFSVISLGMLSILHFFHKVLWLPYGVAIMLLTVVVRACLFPISKKIAKNQQRMKELQPKMEELRKKYADDKEKQIEAYREFSAKHGFNPLAGCLPMFLQLPIFFGLYRALYASVDLRNAEFLWIENLAAPDQLFELPFTVPFVGWTYFNLLPLVTVGLFMAQQKLFMPPPTSDEQAMQYKIMNYFTLFLGLMFYTVPAGLCVYFIVSSLWGICERKLLEKLGFTSTAPGGNGPSGDGDADGGAGGSRGSGGTPVEDPKPKPPGFLARLLEAADEAQRQNQQRSGSGNTNGADRTNPRKKKKKKGRR